MEKGAYGLGLGLRVSGLGFLSLQGICFQGLAKKGSRFRVRLSDPV